MNPSRAELVFGLALTKASAERNWWLNREYADNTELRQRLDLMDTPNQPGVRPSAATS